MTHDGLSTVIMQHSQLILWKKKKKKAAVEIHLKPECASYDGDVKDKLGLW